MVNLGYRATGTVRCLSIPNQGSYVGVPRSGQVCIGEDGVASEVTAIGDLATSRQTGVG